MNVRIYQFIKHLLGLTYVTVLMLVLLYKWEYKCLTMTYNAIVFFSFLLFENYERFLQ